MTNLCHPLIRPPHLDGYDGPSLCDDWYSFFPHEVWRVQNHYSKGTRNPVYDIGECSDVDLSDDDIAGCYIHADIRASYACPGGYTIVYQLDVFDVSEGWKHAYGSRTTCAKCASRAIRNSRLKLGVIRVEKVTAWPHDEGPPIACDYCETEMESSYGDPNESEDT